MVKKIYLSLLLLVLNLANPATLFASSETQGNQVENSLKILQKPSADQIAFVKPKEEEKKEEQTITKSEKPQEKKSTKKENNPKDQEAKLVNKLSHLDYKTQNPPQKLYNREQTYNNQHLPPVYFKSYYLSLAFKAAEKNDIKGLNAVLSKYNFTRVETVWAGGTWGDAFYVKNKLNLDPSIVVSTADPCKFDDIIEPIILDKVPISEELKKLLNKKLSFINIEPNLTELKNNINK